MVYLLFIYLFGMSMALESLGSGDLFSGEPFRTDMLLCFIVREPEDGLKEGMSLKCNFPGLFP